MASLYPTWGGACQVGPFSLDGENQLKKSGWPALLAWGEGVSGQLLILGRSTTCTWLTVWRMHRKRPAAVRKVAMIVREREDAPEGRRTAPQRRGWRLIGVFGWGWSGDVFSRCCR